MPWLEAVSRSWVPLPVHGQYGFELPEIKTVRLEENIAEEIAKLNRTTTARNIHDLVWIMRTAAVASRPSMPLVRRLAVPVPSAAELSDEIRKGFAFLANLDETEMTLAEASRRDRALAIQAMGELPGSRLRNAGLH